MWKGINEEGEKGRSVSSLGGEVAKIRKGDVVVILCECIISCKCGRNMLKKGRLQHEGAAVSCRRRGAGEEERK